MKALTLWEPWATLVVGGAKGFETRTWRTHYTGPLVIHAAKRWTEEQSALCWSDGFQEALAEILGGDPVPRHRGCVLGSVRLVGCHPIDRRFAETVRQAHGDRELLFGNWESGRHAWELIDPERLDEPIPWAGEQGLWELAADWRDR